MLLIGILGDALNPQSTVDVWGHVGGLLVGFFFMPILQQPLQDDTSACCSFKYWYWMSVFVISSFTIGGFLGFYLGN